MLARLKPDFTALRGPRAVSPLMYLMAGAGLFLSAFEFELTKPSAGVSDALVIATTSTAAALLVLLAADRTVLRRRSERLLPTALVLAVYVLCGIAREAAASLTVVVVDAPIRPEFTARAVGGVILVAAWLWIIAIILDTADRDRATTLRLYARRAQLTSQREHYAVALERGRASIAALVDSVTEPAIQQSRALMQELAGDHHGAGTQDPQVLTGLAFRMRDQAEGRVRELSHVLQSDEPQFSEDDLAVPVPRNARPSNPRWFRRAVKQASAIDPIQPTAVALTALLAAFPLLTYTFGFHSLLVPCAITGAIVTFLFLAGVRRAVSGQLRNWNQLTRIGVLLVVAAVAGLLAAATIYLWFPSERVHFAAVTLRCIEVLVVAMGAWAVVAASVAQSTRAQRDLAATVAEIDWQTRLLHDELSRVQLRASEIVHGRVQGRIIAAALVISMHARTLAADPAAADATAASLEQATEMLREAADDVRSIQSEGAAGQVSVEVALAAIAEAWRGVVEVDAVVDPGAGRVVDGAPGLAATVADIARDAVSNAARHGSARSVSIALSSTETTVRLTATDDGVGVRHHPKPGIGLGQIGRADGTWSLQNGQAHGAVLAVELPLPAVAAPALSDRRR